jgi:hypothetical protein
VAFLRFSRDKRGYENIYLVETQSRRGKPSRQRVLYWYRTPPGVRVGRPPFDEEARRRIEAQNPGVIFDWPAIVATPIPPVTENEQWRERRRAERAAKQAHRAEEEAEVRAARETTPEVSGEVKPELITGHDTPENSPPENAAEVAALEAEPQPAGEADFPTEIASGASEALALQASSDRPLDGPVRKRRRRGGRRRRGRSQGGPSGAPGGQSAPPADGGREVTSFDSEQKSNESSPDFETGEFDPNEE